MGDQEGFPKKLCTTFNFIRFLSPPISIALVNIRMSKIIVEGSILLEHLVVPSGQDNVSFMLPFSSTKIPTANLKEKSIRRKCSFL